MRPTIKVASNFTSLNFKELLLPDLTVKFRIVKWKKIYIYICPINTDPYSGDKLAIFLAVPKTGTTRSLNRKQGSDV